MSEDEKVDRSPSFVVVESSPQTSAFGISFLGSPISATHAELLSPSTQKPSPAQWQTCFATYDLDGDGELLREEFVKVIEALHFDCGNQLFDALAGEGVMAITKDQFRAFF